MPKEMCRQDGGENSPRATFYLYQAHALKFTCALKFKILLLLLTGFQQSVTFPLNAS